MRSDTSASGPIHRAAEGGRSNVDETTYPVKLSLLPRMMPLYLLASIGAVCYFTDEDAERQAASLRGVLENPAPIHRIAITSYGTILATSDAAGIVRLWHPESRRTRVLPGERAHALCLAFAPDGTTLAVGDAKSKISIWDVASGEKKWSFAEHSGWVGAVAFSPDGTTLASGGGDKCVYLWDLASRRLKARLDGPTDAVTAVAFAPDGRTLVSGSQDGSIRCWDGATSHLRWLIPPPVDRPALTVFCLRFSADRKVLASTSRLDPCVRLRDPATGQESACLCGPAESMISMDFAADGASLVTGDSRGDLTLWDLESRSPRHSWKGHGDWVHAVAFFADGQTLASAGDQTVKLWEMPMDDRDRHGTVGFRFRSKSLAGTTESTGTADPRRRVPRPALGLRQMTVYSGVSRTITGRKPWIPTCPR